MAHDPINSSEIAAGQPTKQELFQKIKGNDDDHETRLELVEIAVANFIPIQFDVIGPYWAAGAPLVVCNTFRVPFDMTLISALLQIGEAGISGTTEVDVEYKRGGGSWTSIFSVRPSVSYSAGDNAKSSNAVLAVTSLLADDLLRAKQTSVQNLGVGYQIYLGWEPA